MYDVLVVAETKEPTRDLLSRLSSAGFTCCDASTPENTLAELRRRPEVDLVVVMVNGAKPDSAIRRLPHAIKETVDLPVIALLSDNSMDVLDSAVDDFVMDPWNAGEVAARARRLLKRSNDQEDEEKITCGNLAIDPTRCEVKVDGRLLELTFKEYELLKFLACNHGRVFTREALLNKVWGYDYYGGDRTVDVHIRRLRSKLGDFPYIDTVRNIGYRFKEPT